MSSEVQQRSRCLGVDVLSDEHRIFVREAIDETIEEWFVPLDPNLDVVAVYIAGSFAEGTARRIVSDLDLRVIVDGEVHQENAETMANRLKTVVTSQLPEDRLFGYVDPQVYPTWADAADIEDLPRLDPRAQRQLESDTDDTTDGGDRA